MMCVNREIWIVTREAGSRSTSYIQRLLHDMCVRIVTREAGFVKLLTCFVENAK